MVKFDGQLVLTVRQLLSMTQRGRDPGAPLVTVFSSIIPAYSASKLLTRELPGPAAATLCCYNMYVFAFFPAFCHAWLWVKRPAMEGGPSVSYAQLGYCL